MLKTKKIYQKSRKNNFKFWRLKKTNIPNSKTKTLIKSMNLISKSLINKNIYTTCKRIDFLTVQSKSTASEKALIFALLCELLCRFKPRPT